MTNSQFPTGQECAICGGVYNLYADRVYHAPTCPNFVALDAVEPSKPSNVASFALARADRGSKPREHKPADALDLAREWMEQCGPDNQPDHIIVFMGRTNSDNSSGTKYFQTGNFSAHAQVGLVYEGLDMLRGSGYD